jgi:hypothetical protein
MTERPEPKDEDAEESDEELGPLPYTSADSTAADVEAGSECLHEAAGCLHDLAGCFTVVAGLIGLAALLAVAAAEAVRSPSSPRPPVFRDVEVGDGSR